MKKVERVGYKIVNRHGSLLMSGFIMHNRKIYGIGRTTVRTRGCGPLGLWKRKRVAIDYMNAYSDNLDYRSELYRATYIESADTGFWLPQLNGLGEAIFAPDNLIPNGTMFADEIELLEKVDTKEE